LQFPYASNLVVTRKKDGGYRLCVDHCRLNQDTVKDTYVPTRQDVCMESMSGMTYFSKLDIRMAFHKIEVRKCDQPKTAFICKQGTFSFRRMPFQIHLQHGVGPSI
jgi:hypothetical protein